MLFVLLKVKHKIPHCVLLIKEPATYEDYTSNPNEHTHLTDTI